MIFLDLTVYRRVTDQRPPEPISVNMELVQVMESHDNNSTRIQFKLNEPSLYVKESKTEIYKAMRLLTQHQLKVV